MITEPAKRYVFFKNKNTADAVFSLYDPSVKMKEWRIEKQICKIKIKKLLCKKFTRKNKLIFLGYFNIVLSNKDRSIGNKGFCESQEELMRLIMEFDLEDIWRRQNLNVIIYVLSWQEQYLLSYW